MENLTVLYGTKRGCLIEDLITESKDLNHIEKAEEWAKNNGFEKLRKVVFTDNIFEVPVFEKTLNI